MATQTASEPIQTSRPSSLPWPQWLKIALQAALAAIIPVLAVQALAISLWPEVARFKPLDSYFRSALFTLVPALAATALFAWLAGRRPNPAATFAGIAGVVLLLSFIPDYLLPVPYRTILASSVAAFLHLIAGLVITTVIIAGYRRAVSGGRP